MPPRLIDDSDHFWRETETQISQSARFQSCRLLGFFDGCVSLKLGTFNCFGVPSDFQKDNPNSVPEKWDTPMRATEKMTDCFGRCSPFVDTVHRMRSDRRVLIKGFSFISH